VENSVSVSPLLDRAREPEYWKQLNPGSSIGPKNLLSTSQIDISSSIIASAQKSLRLDGYFQIAPLLSGPLIGSLALGVLNIRKSGWPTPFVVVYDEYWEMFHSLGALFSSVLGKDYKQIPNFWCWYVDNNSESKGWGHHRDRPSVKAVRSDGLPDSLTVWIPLTDATVLNGCIYVIPSRFDQNYPNNLESADIGNPQNIRALPAPKGSVLGWSENIVHWGSRSSDRANEPRISISFTYQRSDVKPFEIPLFDTDKLPTFEERLGLIGQNVVKYQGHANSSSEVLSVCESLGNLIPPIQVPDSFDLQILDTDKRLSETSLWRIQEEYFEREGFSAWDVVPFYTTSRTPFCDLYVEMAIAVLLDLADHLDKDAPLYFLEIGGGLGCFAYRFLKALLVRCARYAKLKDLKIRYVLTDFTPKNVGHFLKMNRLKSLIDSNILDVAVFRPSQEETIKLLRSGETLSAGSMRNPLITIANYFFDSIPHDAYRVLDGRLSETRFTVTRSARDCDLNAPLQVQDLRMLERYFECPANFYGDNALDSILEFYRDNLKEASVIFPTGAFRAISNLLRLSNDQLVLFTIDKGFTTLNSNQIKGLWKQEFSKHGSFSFQVNFDAIARYFAALGGQSFMEAGDHFGLCTNANVLLKGKNIALDHFGDVFAESVSRRDLANSLFNIEEVLYKSTLLGSFERSKIAIFLSILQVYSFEPFVFGFVLDKMFDELEPELVNAKVEQKEEVLTALELVWNNIYHIKGHSIELDNVFRCYVALDRFEDCFRVAQEALNAFGPVGTILDHLALSCESMGKLDLAYQYFHRAVEQKPNHAWALAGLERTKHALGGRK
jgi:tetratricopeptide (TPR) repeat protein